MRALALAAMLCLGSPAIGPRAPIEHLRGTLLKTVATRDGVVRVYRNAAGCDLWLGGVWEQSVSWGVCSQ